MPTKTFARFFALLAKLPLGEGITPDALRHSLVSQYSEGRTTSLRDLTPEEYSALCRDLEAKTNLREHLRQQRSLSLKLMQRMGIDTSDWTRVNAFCQDARICGKPFAKVTAEEHAALQRKLRAMARKGGLRQRQAANVTYHLLYPLTNHANQPH